MKEGQFKSLDSSHGQSLNPGPCRMHFGKDPPWRQGLDYVPIDSKLGMHSVCPGRNGCCVCENVLVYEESLSRPRQLCFQWTGGGELSGECEDAHQDAHLLHLLRALSTHRRWDPGGPQSLEPPRKPSWACEVILPVTPCRWPCPGEVPGFGAGVDGVVCGEIPLLFTVPFGSWWCPL